MPTAGLSLVGFLDEQAALNHLRSTCVPADPSDPALIAHWQAARQKLGAPFSNAGHPDIQAIPSKHNAYLAPLQQLPWPGAELRLVEIDPLLAYQIHVDMSRSGHHCGPLSHPPNEEELVQLCLPLNQPADVIQVSRTAQSTMLKSRSLNFQGISAGLMRFVDPQNTFDVQVMGIQLGWSAPFVHVVRHNGRCYLHNGFHRACGVRLAGATHIPCVFRDVPDHAAVGIKQDGGTFTAPLLESENPPTLAHFTQGRGYDVNVRSVSRVLHVSWADYVIPDE